MAKKSVNIPETYKALTVVQKKIEDLKAKVKVLEAEAETYKADLIIAIPENAVKDGVYHKVWDKPSVAYAKVLADVQENLIPKTKWAQIEVYKEANTSHSIQHSISIPKEKA